MATIKSYTDLEQSKKLAEILSLDSADMVYIATTDDYIGDTLYTAEIKSEIYISEDDAERIINCWSLAALLEVLPFPTLYQQRDGAWGLDVLVEQVKPYSVKNAICEVDACYEMILKLNELNLL